MLPAHCSNSSRFSYSNTKNIKPREFDSPSLSPRRASSARLLFFMGGRELLAGLNQGKSASPAAALRPRFFIVPYFSSMGAQVRERAFIFIFFLFVGTVGVYCHWRGTMVYLSENGLRFEIIIFYLKHILGIHVLLGH